MSNRERFAFGVVLVAIVVIPGLASAVLHSLGYSTLGTATWVLGYGMGILTVWYVWIRPLDIRGPSGVSPDEPERDG